jgi:hypothetical protein
MQTIVCLILSYINSIKKTFSNIADEIIKKYCKSLNMLYN